MKLKTLLATITLLTASLLISCKKEIVAESSTLKVRYELTTNSPFVTDPTYVSLNTFSFVKDANMSEEIVINLTGKSWIKELSIENKRNIILGFGGNFLLQGISGTCNAKIYVNGVLKAENNQSASIPISSMTSTGVSIQWANQ